MRRQSAFVYKWKNMKIYVCTHKKFIPPKDTLYVPIQVGSALHDKLGYLCDDTYDNISKENPYYSELTGLYWIWKNDKDSDIVGTAHYRRYLVDDNKNLYNEGQIRLLLMSYDIITTKLLELDYPYYDAFNGKHHSKDLDILENVIKNLRGEYLKDYQEIIHGKRTYFGNMFIMKKKLYDEYMQFLFPVLLETQKLVDMTGYNGYQKRLFGFMSEVLLYVFVKHKQLKVKESLVGMSGGKAETLEVKQELAKYFKNKDIKGAKKYFLSVYQKRPDILMEASDVNLEGRLCMQAISSLEWELETCKDTRLDRCEITDYTDIDNLVKFYNKLNLVVRENDNIADCSFIKENAVSEAEIMVSKKVVFGS